MVGQPQIIPRQRVGAAEQHRSRLELLDRLRILPCVNQPFAFEQSARPRRSAAGQERQQTTRVTQLEAVDPQALPSLRQTALQPRFLMVSIEDGGNIRPLKCQETHSRTVSSVSPLLLPRRLRRCVLARLAGLRCSGARWSSSSASSPAGASCGPFASDNAARAPMSSPPRTRTRPRPSARARTSPRDGGSRHHQSDRQSHCARSLAQPG